MDHPWARSYLLVQAIVGQLWWWSLESPKSSEAFGMTVQFGWLLFFPDLFMYVLGSVVVAFAADKSWFRPALYVLTGAICYATLACVMLTPLAFGCMALSLLGTVFFLVRS